MAGSELPVVLMNVMRGGPGPRQHRPSQADYFQAVKGHGHGDYRVPVLAPSSIAEAVTLVADAFEIAERYRTPVIVLADGILGQAMEPVSPSTAIPPAPAADWAVTGADGRRAAGREVAPPPARRTSRRTTATCRPSSRRSRTPRSAGPARTSRTRNS